MGMLRRLRCFIKRSNFFYALLSEENFMMSFEITLDNFQVLMNSFNEIYTFTVVIQTE